MVFLKATALAVILVGIGFGSLGATAAAEDNYTGQSSIRTKSFQSARAFGLDIQYVPSKFEKYDYSEGVVSNSNGHGVHVAFEWMILQEYGKVALGVGSGFNFNKATITTSSVTDASATLYTIPIEAYLAYRFDYFENQWVVPFAKFGANATLTKQNSNQGAARSGMTTYSGLDYGGGIQINLNILEPGSARSLDETTGINTTYLIGEVIRSSAFSAGKFPDLSRTEFRVGLRFEM